MKSPSRLAPKILIPQTYKETMLGKVQVERPKHFPRVPKTKEFVRASQKPGLVDLGQWLRENH